MTTDPVIRQDHHVLAHGFLTAQKSNPFSGSWSSDLAILSEDLAILSEDHAILSEDHAILSADRVIQPAPRSRPT